MCWTTFCYCISKTCWVIQLDIIIFRLLCRSNPSQPHIYDACVHNAFVLYLLSVSAQVQYKGIVYTRIINMWLGGIWTAKIKPGNNYVKLYNSASFWDTITKVRSKYSLRRPLSETSVILNFWRIFRLQNGRRREVAVVFLQRCDTERVQYNGIVYTRIINMWLGRIWTAKIKPGNNYVKLYNSASFWDTITKVRSKYSLRRPLSESSVILNFGRIFRLQNGRRRQVAVVFLQRWDTEQVQYKGIVYTHIINMWLGRIWTAKKAGK